MLEWMVRCPHCDAPCGGISLPPWRWWYQVMGARCWKCHRLIPPSVLRGDT